MVVKLTHLHGSSQGVLVRAIEARQQSDSLDFRGERAVHEKPATIIADSRCGMRFELDLKEISHLILDQNRKNGFAR